MEELVRDIPKCRAVFERWMKWMPDDNAWTAYARFETRCGGGSGGCCFPQAVERSPPPLT